LSKDKNFLQELQNIPDLSLLSSSWDKQSPKEMAMNKVRENYASVFWEEAQKQIFLKPLLLR